LRARLGQNSSNSSRPPSSDGPAKPAPKSLRRRCGRRPGGQPSHPGSTLARVSDPDDVVRHEPQACAGCGEGLAEALAVAPRERSSDQEGAQSDHEQASQESVQQQAVRQVLGIRTRPIAAGRKPAPRPITINPRDVCDGAEQWRHQSISGVPSPGEPKWPAKPTQVSPAKLSRLSRTPAAASHATAWSRHVATYGTAATPR
jgi:hypothetical protein